MSAAQTLMADAAETLPVLEGGCFCGTVRLRVTGSPVAMGYCHCDSCRHWSASPVNGFTLWKPDTVAVTRGADRMDSYARTPNSYRKWCKDCGGHLFTDHPATGLVDVYAAVIPGLDFQPAVHVNYQEAVLGVRDGKPKFKDLPAEMGGSGLVLEE